MRLGFAFWRIFVAAMLAVLAAVPVAALAEPVSACVAKLNVGENPRSIAPNSPRFDCQSPQNSHGPGDFVTQLHFAPQTATADNPLVLRTGSVWQNAESLRFIYADGSEAQTSFTAKTTAPHLTLGAILEFPVPYRPAELTNVLITTQGSANLRGVVVGAQLMPRSEAQYRHILFTAIYSAFGGLALALFIYNLSLYRALRNRFQLHYSMMVAALIGYAFTSSGALALLVPAMGNNDRLRVNYILLVFCAVTGARFVQTFFEREVREPWLRRAIRNAAIACLASALAFAMFAPWQIALLDQLYFITISALVAASLVLLALAGLRRARHFPLFLFAWSAPIVITILRIGYGFHLLPYSVWLDNGNLVAMAIEAMLSSLLVTARVREITQQRDSAIAGEQTARELAAIDPLTGLLNRRAFLDQAIGLRSRQQLLLIDIDHFKQVNDRLGHDAGDQVLVAVARAVESCRPPRSLAVRLGGEEFALVIPMSAGKRFAAQLLGAVRDSAMPQGITVTVSVGIAEGQISSEDDWKRLYRLADAALYRAKADGRDRACKATDFRDAA